MSTAINLTKRERRRTLKSGNIVVHTRWVLNYREPRTGKRKQLFFDRQKDAQAKRNQIVTEIATGAYAGSRQQITVAEAVRRWLANRQGEVKGRTLHGYRHTARYIIGPLLIGTPLQRSRFSVSGRVPDGTRLVPMLRDVKVHEITTGDIRAWHKIVTTEVGSHSANRAKMFLAAALALAAEDMNCRAPVMPTNLGRAKSKQKKTILIPEQVAKILEGAKTDRERGLYVAFPFLTGTRPSEQLGLLWEDVDFEKNVIHIRRMQERDGSLTNLTKTVAGTRDIPMCTLLRNLLMEWRLACPRRGGELHRVFPGLGQQQAWPLPRIGGGGPLLYGNFRRRFWVPMLKRLRLPAVTPHCARHSFISTLQVLGIEVGLVAKLAGHASAAVTLGHYTQAVRGAESAVAALERAYIA